jgi:hypothetical protein
MKKGGEGLGISEWANIFPRLAPILNVWFNPTLGRRLGISPCTMPEFIQTRLFNKVEAILQYRPTGMPQDIIGDARSLIEDVLALSLRDNQGALHHHVLAAKEAIGGEPFYCSFYLRG